ncbi:MAG: LPS export ABC transporter permease LptG [Gammaproteobacteria bacterium]|jgi:lipopolysaccharide export system permease protein
MKTVDRYLTGQIFGGLLIATIALLPLFGFLDLLNQLNDVGKGSYQVKDAFVYVILLMPRRFIELTPFIALLGNVAALGRLAIHRELIPLRSAGFSPARISLSSLRVGLFLLLITAVLEQFVAPPLEQEADLRRSAALEQSMELGRDLGIWSRDKRNILRIGKMEHVSKPTDIEIMHFGDDGFLQSYIHAANADIIKAKQWRLNDVTTKTFDAQRIESVHTDTMEWKPFLDREQVSTLSKPPESLSPVELFNQVRFLRATGQAAKSYALALWRKAGGVLTTIAMLLLSVPFVFGSVRSGLGSRLVLAGLTGMGVYLLDLIISNAGLLLNLNPALVALSPGAVLIVLAWTWLRRVH